MGGVVWGMCFRVLGWVVVGMVMMMMTGMGMVGMGTGAGGDAGIKVFLFFLFKSLI